MEDTPIIISDQKSSSGLVFLFSLIFLVIGIIFGYLLARYFPISNLVPQKTCTPRPACLDATPRCMIPETSDMCPHTITPTPTPTKIQYQCPASGYVDCMPILSEEGKRACSAEAMAWYKANCPDFKGTAL